MRRTPASGESVPDGNFQSCRSSERQRAPRVPPPRAPRVLLRRARPRARGSRAPRLSPATKRLEPRPEISSLVKAPATTEDPPPASRPPSRPAPLPAPASVQRSALPPGGSQARPEAGPDRRGHPVRDTGDGGADRGRDEDALRSEPGRVLREDSPERACAGRAAHAEHGEHPTVHALRRTFALGCAKERSLEGIYPASRAGSAHRGSEVPRTFQRLTAAWKSSRARRRREATVPTGMPSSSAISAAASSSTSNRTNTARRSSGSTGDSVEHRPRLFPSTRTSAAFESSTGSSTSAPETSRRRDCIRRTSEATRTTCRRESCARSPARPCRACGRRRGRPARGILRRMFGDAHAAKRSPHEIIVLVDHPTKARSSAARSHSCRARKSAR